MIITIKNVNKKLLNKDVTSDLHFVAFQYPSEEVLVNFHVYETDAKGVTRYVTSKICDKENAQEDYVMTRGMKSLHIRLNRLIVTDIKKGVDVLICTDHDVFNDEEHRVVACQMYNYMLIDKRHTQLAIQQNNDYCVWGFKYAYQKAIENIHKFTDDRQVNSFNCAVYEEDNIDFERIKSIMNEEIIEY